MYRYIVDIEILKTGNKYQVIDIDEKNSMKIIIAT